MNIKVSYQTSDVLDIEVISLQGHVMISIPYSNFTLLCLQLTICIEIVVWYSDLSVLFLWPFL